MGAAVTIELQKPVDGSDIKSTGQLDHAKAEITRLRGLLGHLAKDMETDGVIYDAHDLCMGVNEAEDFNRCIEEICHIRKALQMSTQRARRKTRLYKCTESLLSDLTIQPPDPVTPLNQPQASLSSFVDDSLSLNERNQHEVSLKLLPDSGSGSGSDSDSNSDQG